jgi:dipeptidyl aminopeptidase/acylaminoacyl peptidase
MKSRSKGWRFVRYELVAALAALTTPACSGDPTDPAKKTGEIAVTVTMTGPDQPAGYSILVAGRSASPSAQGITSIAGLLPGDYPIRVVVQANCRVDGDNPRTVTVAAGRTTTVQVAVTCSAATGALRFTVATSGVDLDRDGYAIRIEGFTVAGQRYVQTAAVGVNETVSIGSVPTGPETVTLRGLATNCDVVGTNPLKITLEAAETKPVAFGVDCVRASDVIAYLAGRPDIYVIDPNSRDVRRLTTERSFNNDPVWSPDGRRLAFTSDRNGKRDIFVMDADGSNQVQLTTADSDDYNPTWSPGGDRIAFVSERAGNPELFVMDANGGNVQRITNTPSRETEPAWSPDGRRIAFTGDATGRSEVYIMNADGTGTTRLTPEGGRQPAWSHDGTALALTAPYCAGYPYGCSPAIYIWSGNVFRRLVSFGPAEKPSWSPDGRKIAYSAMECDYYVIQCSIVGMRIGRVDDSDVAELNVGFNPAWRP